MRVTTEQKQATRAALITAVADLVESEGPDAATVTAVAARAGVTTGAIYSHFGDRTVMLAEGVEELRARLVPSFPAELPLPQALAEFCARYLALVHTTEGLGLMLAQTVLSVRLLTDKALLANEAVGTAQTLEEFGEALQASADRAGFRLAMSASRAAALLMSTLKGAAMIAVATPDLLPAEMVSDGLHRMLADPTAVPGA